MRESDIALLMFTVWLAPHTTKFWGYVFGAVWFALYVMRAYLEHLENK